jgi:hypothetical protein
MNGRCIFVITEHTVFGVILSVYSLSCGSNSNSNKSPMQLAILGDKIQKIIIEFAYLLTKIKKNSSSFVFPEIYFRQFHVFHIKCNFGFLGDKDNHLLDYLSMKYVISFLKNKIYLS